MCWYLLKLSVYRTNTVFNNVRYYIIVVTIRNVGSATPVRFTHHQLPLRILEHQRSELVNPRVSLTNHEVEDPGHK